VKETLELRIFAVEGRRPVSTGAPARLGADPACCRGRNLARCVERLETRICAQRPNFTVLGSATIVLTRYNDRMALVLEIPAGRRRSTSGRPLGVSYFLRIAIPSRGRSARCMSKA